MKQIKATSISGFPELLPEARIIEQRMINIIRSNFERYGFSPIETASVERTTVLTAKGVSEKEIYGLRRLSSQDADDTKDLALHFDLTVPFARYVAQNFGRLTFPFRRYQIQKVWRGERPQSGRFREFYQCDIDVIGNGKLSLFNDAEMPSVIFRIFKEMEIGPFVIQINNRKIFKGYFQHLNISEDKIVDVLRVIDKIDKIGTDRVLSELVDIIKLSTSIADKLIEFVEIDGSTKNILEKLHSMKIGGIFIEGLSELEKVVEYVSALGVPEEYFAINLKIARGLDYYTGTIYETVLSKHPGLGSICSGGRYDDLASCFIDKKLPGVGVSIGLTRLFSRLIQAEILKVGASTTASVLITVMDNSHIKYYFEIAAMLRNQGINTEVFFEQKKIGAQLKYANNKGFAFVVIAGSNEIDEKKVQLKNLKTGEQVCLEVTRLGRVVREGLNNLHKKGLYII